MGGNSTSKVISRFIWLSTTAADSIQHKEPGGNASVTQTNQNKHEGLFSKFWTNSLPTASNNRLRELFPQEEKFTGSAAITAKTLCSCFNLSKQILFYFFFVETTADIRHDYGTCMYLIGHCSILALHCSKLDFLAGHSCAFCCVGTSAVPRDLLQKKRSFKFILPYFKSKCEANRETLASLILSRRSQLSYYKTYHKITVSTFRQDKVH